jgi:hypothetical protein
MLTDEQKELVAEISSDKVSNDKEEFKDVDLHDFMSEYFDTDENARVETNELYKAYLKFWEKTNLEANIRRKD